MTMFSAKDRNTKAEMLGLYSKLKNAEIQLAELKRDIERAQQKIRELIAALIEADKDLEAFR